MTSLDKSVDIVKAAWVQSAYYDNAEQWTPLFWNEGVIFRTFLDRLNLTHCAELACGHGRHTEALLTCKAEHVKQVYRLDVVQENISFCKRRFSTRSHVVCVVCNGKDFEPIVDNSLTGIFCYDAMVHFSPDIVASYVRDARRVLQSGGSMLFHHSNLNAPDTGPNYGRNPHARNHMTMELFSQIVEEARMTILESIPIRWGDVPDLDRLSLVRKP